jgi:hypothetical protein
LTDASRGKGRSLRNTKEQLAMSNTNEAKATETTHDVQPARSGCCGGAAPSASSACCALDAEIQATGGKGCGCAAKSASPTRKSCC